MLRQPPRRRPQHRHEHPSPPPRRQRPRGLPLPPRLRLPRRHRKSLRLPQLRHPRHPASSHLPLLPSRRPRRQSRRLKHLRAPTQVRAANPERTASRLRLRLPNRQLRARRRHAPEQLAPVPVVLVRVTTRLQLPRACRVPGAGTATAQAAPVRATTRLQLPRACRVRADVAKTTVHRVLPPVRAVPVLPPVLADRVRAHRVPVHRAPAHRAPAVQVAPGRRRA
jgi:hypothetical protein